MSDLKGVTARLIREALDNVHDGLIRDSLVHEGHSPSQSNINAVGRLMDELDEHIALADAEQRLMAAEFLAAEQDQKEK
jgi:hypothetical protein